MIFRKKIEALYGPHHKVDKRAATSTTSVVASSSFSSSSYVPSFPASKTFTTPDYSISKSYSRSPSPTPADCGKEDCKFYNSKTEPYFIKEFPDVDFDTGEFYGGSTPIDEDDPSRTLFWIFKPAENISVDEVTIWLNGGPGCSSLEGFLQETGPISYTAGQYRPSHNPFHWAQLTNMLWVEQPVGTGFSQGKVKAKNEFDVADEFNAFFKNWQKTFGIKNYKIYITGESYAGFYIPYIGGGMLDMKDKEYYDLRGALMYDPCIGDCGWVQNTMPTTQFAVNNQLILNLNQSILDDMVAKSATCGIDHFIDKYLQFPPPGHQPTERSISNSHRDCYDVIDDYYTGVTNKNPCYDVYHITAWCPTLPDPKQTYFNRPDVKKAIHAPMNQHWSECSFKSVFAGNGYDVSPLSIEAKLPQVIEATNRVLVANGDWDGLVFTNGTLLAIQNMTWGGKLGFQEKPSKDFEVPLALDSTGFLYHYGRQGVMGIAHEERGLMWTET